jgi:probable HAF family extracellular repeat protein
MPLIPHRAALVGALCLAALPLTAAADGFRLVHVVDGSVTSLSANGRAAAGLSLATFESFHWTARGGLTLLGRNPMAELGHSSGTPHVSYDGKVVSGTIVSDDGTYSTAGRWTAAGGWSMLAPPLPPGGTQMDGEDSSAFGLSGDGAVVTGLYWRTDGKAHAMTWTAATGMLDMGSSGRSSRIDGASADGRVLAGWDEHPQFGNRRAAVWVDGVLTVLEDSDWPSEASAVNRAGTIVVGYSGNPADFQTYATMWSWNGAGWTKTLLGVIHKGNKTGYAAASGVSDDGSMVVGVVRPDVMSPKSQGFVWTPQGGFVDAGDLLKAAGVPQNPLMPIIGVATISADGKVLAVTVQGITAPFATRTQLIRRSTEQ